MMHRWSLLLLRRWKLLQMVRWCRHKVLGVAVAVHLHRCSLCEGISPEAGNVSAIGRSVCCLP